MKKKDRFAIPRQINEKDNGVSQTIISCSQAPHVFAHTGVISSTSSTRKFCTHVPPPRAIYLARSEINVSDSWGPITFQSRK